MGTGGSLGLKRPGSESRSASVLSLASDSANLLLLCESLLYVTCFTVGGSSWCSQHPCPTPWLGVCCLSTTLRLLRPPLHRLSLQRSWKPLPLPQGPWGTETQEAAMPLAWGLLGMGLTTWGTRSDHGWIHMANPVFPVTTQVYFCALYSATHRNPKYIPKSVEISLDSGQEAVPRPASLGKHVLLFT